MECVFKELEENSSKLYCESCCLKQGEYSKMTDKSKWRNLKNLRLTEIFRRKNNV